VLTAENLLELKHNKGKVLTLTCSGGDVIIAKILGIDEEYNEVVCELVSSSRPGKYPPTSELQIAIPLAEIQTVSFSCGRGSLSKRRPSALRLERRRR
jgi:hypothetical protein